MVEEASKVIDNKLVSILLYKKRKHYLYGSN